MEILEKLKNNKGSNSKKLGRELADKVLKGDKKILEEAIELLTYQLGDKKAKKVRSGAAKIIELVAEKNPELVSNDLEKLIPALKADEAQTKLMTYRTMGFCAHLNTEISEKAIPFAKKEIKNKDELCLASSVDLYLGDLGSISEELSKKVYPLLRESVKNNIINEQDWLMDSFSKIVKNLSTRQQREIKRFAEKYQTHPRKTTQQRVYNLLKVID